MPREHVTARGDRLRRDALIDVLIERKDRLRLRAIALDDDGARLLDVGERLVQDLGADAASEGLRAEAREELGERRARGVRGTRRVRLGADGRL